MIIQEIIATGTPDYNRISGFFCFTVLLKVYFFRSQGYENKILSEHECSGNDCRQRVAEKRSYIQTEDRYGSGSVWKKNDRAIMELKLSHGYTDKIRVSVAIISK
jgi:hypothetical protein